MTYSFQNFSVGQVLTAVQMDQVEANIRDHIHGRDSVVLSGLSWRYSNKTANYTIVADDIGTLFSCSGTFTLTLPAIANVASGWSITVHNRGTGLVTVEGNAAETIDGQANIIVGAGGSATLFEDGNAGEFRTYATGGVLAPIGTFSDANQSTKETGIDLTGFDRVFISAKMRTLSSSQHPRFRVKAGGSVITSATYDYERNGAFTTGATAVLMGLETGGGIKDNFLELMIVNGKSTGGVAGDDAVGGWYRTVELSTSGTTAFCSGGWFNDDSTDVLGNAIEDISFHASSGNIDIEGSVYGGANF